ncbi:MAG: hypothetical protein ABJC79_03235, partial [Acidimicrobiia bacterium]
MADDLGPEPGPVPELWCPSCLATVGTAARCPTCGLPQTDPAAAHLRVVVARIHAANEERMVLAAELGRLHTERDRLFA